MVIDCVTFGVVTTMSFPPRVRTWISVTADALNTPGCCC